LNNYDGTAKKNPAKMAQEEYLTDSGSRPFASRSIQDRCCLHVTGTNSPAHGSLGLRIGTIPPRLNVPGGIDAERHLYSQDTSNLHAGKLAKALGMAVIT